MDFTIMKMVRIAKWDEMDESHACCLAAFRQWVFAGGDDEVSDWDAECRVCGTVWHKRLHDGVISPMSPYRVIGHYFVQ
jgi:hypothetical protein